MAIPYKSELQLLNHDERELVRATHYPAICELAREDLQDTLTRLRGLRDKEKTQYKAKRRETKGTGEARGGSFPGTSEQPRRRKQVFAQALKRVNKEIERHRKFEAKAELGAAARRALALKRSGDFHRPSPGVTAHEGMSPLPSRRRRTTVHPSKIGQVSQWTKIRQAQRDARP
ncbi:hypothetical protein [Rhodomicrobium lacus]|jgi:hypothetical protein|uniref:hypothetical protein n=1 Tax=Rhodomicrobium lacus TaxID=2498452 RepID=UPI0026E2C452|nr:hypothetical protein [Rhodomicrobium lacus]WKW49466.1 hypothetical protein QMO75_09130 [Rhodomicrobium lacus]